MLADSVAVLQYTNWLLEDARYERAGHMAEHGLALPVLDKRVQCSLYTNRGYAAHRLGKHAQALFDTIVAVELDPESHRSLLLRSMAYDAIGDHQRALQVHMLQLCACLACRGSSCGTMWIIKH